jgi:translation initiation factor 1A
MEIRGGRMGKKKVLRESDLRKMVYSSENDGLCVVQKMLGFDRVLVKCQDGHTRTTRIRGKMKRRTSIREGDVVLVAPWDFQGEESGRSSTATPRTRCSVSAKSESSRSSRTGC